MVKNSPNRADLGVKTEEGGGGLRNKLTIQVIKCIPGRPKSVHVN